MPDDELLQQLLTTFRAEAADHLQTINQSLLKLERAPDDNLRAKTLQNAFRSAHSLKGAARAVSLTEIEALSHTMESVFQKARDEGLELGADICDVLYDCLDVIEQLLGGDTVDIKPVQVRLVTLAEDGEFLESTPVRESEPADTAPVPQESAEMPVQLAGEETIRVSVSKLDDLMAQVGELLVTKISADQRLVEVREVGHSLDQWSKSWRDISNAASQVSGTKGQHLEEMMAQHSAQTETLFEVFHRLNQAISRDTTRLGMVTAGLQDKVRDVRMVPFQSLVFALERAIRDASRSERKQVRFGIEGTDVELDKKVLEILKDPLLHIVRNAVSHGIEAPDDRAAAGKQPEGYVQVDVQQRGSEVHITIADDGRGFDIEGLRSAHATRTGKTVEDYANEDEVVGLAFLPGMTTASEVTAISGRGVGLDVVRQSLGKIQGRISVDTEPGQGATINLIVPVSLAMMRALMVRAGREQYALPLLSIEKIIEPEDTFVVGNRQMINVDNLPLPLVSLAGTLQRASIEEELSANPLAVVLSVANQRLAFLVDDVLTEQELAVKALGMPLKTVLNVTGAAILGNGDPVVILNPADLVQSARGVEHRQVRIQQQDDDELSEAKIHILVVDDSITTRTLEKNILEAAGYDVTIATDGTEALDRLAEHETIRLVVADVEMPQMDGITLVKTLREMPQYIQMPVILVTSLESREDRERGLVAGANAYIVKRGFDQAELLATIEHLL